MLEATYKTYKLLFGAQSSFELTVGVKPSFGFFKMSSVDVTAVLVAESGAPGDLVLTDGINTITLKNIYLVKSVKHQIPKTEETVVRICDVVFADERILWYFKNGIQDYNTYKASREGIDDFVLTNTNADNNDEPWTFSELVTELKTLTGASDLILNGTDFSSYPAREPRQIIGCNIPVYKIVQQLLENLNAFLTVNLNDSGNVTYELYRLGLIETPQDIVQLGTYAPMLKEKRTIELNATIQHGATIKMVAAAEDVLNSDLRSRLYGSATMVGGTGDELVSSIYAVLGDEKNLTELETIGDEISQEHADSFANTWRNEIYTGLIPFKLNRAVHSVRWLFSGGGIYTHIKAFRPRSNPTKLRDNLFHYSRFSIGVGSQGYTFARIVQSLQEEDLTASPTIVKRDTYEIELLDLAIARYVDGSGTYVKDEFYKWDDGSGADKLYKVLETFTQPPDIIPSTSSHWEESSWVEARIFGYDDSSSSDLTESGNWLVPGQIVIVFRYEDARFSDIEWWIDETVIRTKNGDEFSIGFIPTEKRMAAFYK